MGIGDAWLKTAFSDAKGNKMTIISGTGAYLAGVTKANHTLLVCTSTGSGFTINHVYLCNADGTTVTDLADIVGSGGASVIDLFIPDPKFYDLMLTKTNDLDRANWIQTTTSTATIANDTDGSDFSRSIKLLTGATSGSGATISYPHLQNDFSKTSMFQFKIRFSATTALAYHGGVGADDVTAADSNTVKYNAEVCTVTNGNWWLRSASGSANSTSDTGIAFTTSRVGIRIEHYPTLGTPRADMYVGAGTVLQKTSNIPVSGATADVNLIKHSLKNSAAADKNAYIYGTRLRYTISDEWV
jgi:hypothetical protein